MTEYLIKVQDLEYSYPDGTKALDGLTLALPAGKKIAFLGANGAGKSTFFLHLNGLNRPQAGYLTYGGQKYSYQNKFLQELRRKVGLVFQDPDNQLFSSSVLQDVSFGPYNLGYSAQEIQHRVEKALQQTGLWEVRAKPTHFLSVGQKKRAAIAGVLAMDPEVVVLDEPTANLDPKHVRNIMDILSALNEEGKTVVISSHDLDGVLAWADYLFVLKKGRLLGEGPPQEIFSNDFLLAEAELEKPLLWQVYQALAARGLLKEDCLAGPRRLGDILADLKENNKDRKR